MDGLERPIRVLIAKPGLDGHDRGALVVAQGLRDEGMEVIYTGLRQTPEAIAAAAVQEDVACVGLSSLSGAHLELFPEVVQALRARGADDILVIGGGIIPDEDINALKNAGIAEIFTPGSSIKQMADYIRQHARTAQLPALASFVEGLDHIGIAVNSLTIAQKLYKDQLGAKEIHHEEVVEQGVRVSILRMGQTEIELLEPLHEESPVARFLAKRGSGVHHLAYRVKDIQAALQAAKTAGFRLIDDQPRRGAHGKWVAFLHPSSMQGVLTELCQPREDRQS
ncbi:methylmalonyl-CoA epimerase [Alicyclobacillus tolerans]|uniref:methylmalonyl-CoA epimerase n=1 Tax=Alicyclobacillus TaxID=29330 RepID=UPI00351C76F9